MQQDYQWCRVADEWGRPKRRAESEDIEARGDSDERDYARDAIMLYKSRPPLLADTLFIRPEFSLFLPVPVPKAHYITFALAHRYLVRRNKVCALTLAMSDPMKYI